jgi:hypothetical protein
MPFVYCSTSFGTHGNVIEFQTDSSSSSSSNSSSDSDSDSTSGENNHELWYYVLVVLILLAVVIISVLVRVFFRKKRHYSKNHFNIYYGQDEKRTGCISGTPKCEIRTSSV